MDEIDIWDAAETMIRQHGVRAIAEACKHELRFLKSGDNEAATIWRRVILAIDRATNEMRQCRRVN